MAEYPNYLAAKPETNQFLGGEAAAIIKEIYYTGRRAWCLDELSNGSLLNGSRWQLRNHLWLSDPASDDRRPSLLHTSPVRVFTDFGDVGGD